MAKINASMVEGLNAQLGRELAASQQYLAIAVYLQGRSLENFAAFYFRQVDEERDHAMRILRYLLEVGARPIVPHLDAPSTDFSSLTEVVKLSLGYEEAVTAAIHELVDAASDDKDYATFQFLQWYVAEQIEEEATFSKLLDIIEMSDNVLQVEAYVSQMSVAKAGE